MKAITLRPEYAHAILRGEKIEEYRSWPTSHRGPLVIHCGAPEKCLLCLVDVIDCVEDASQGGYVWLLENVRPLERVSMGGKLSLWTVPDEAVRLLEVQTQQ